MSLLETYKSTQEYITNYIRSKTSFYFDVIICDNFHTVMIYVISEYDMPFTHLMCRLKELKINFMTDYTWGHIEEYIVLTKDEYLKLYVLTKLKGAL